MTDAEPWPLPDGWRWSRFDEVARVASNLVDPAAHPRSAHIAPNHIESETGRLLPYRTIADDAVTSPKHQFLAGQVLYSKIRPYLAKVVVADIDGLCSADMYPIDTELDARYLKWWMLTPEFTRRAAGEQARTVLPKINVRSLSALPVPVAPLDQQLRIVESLEDHLSRLDAAAATLVRARQAVRALRRAVLFGLVPEKAPVHWQLVTVADAGSLDLGRQRHPDWHVGPEMRPYLRVANVFEDRIDTRDVMQMDFSGVFDRYKLHPGDVLLNEGQTPELLGRPAIYRGEPTGVAFTNSLIRFRANDDVLPEWALLVFRRHMHAGRFRRESRITTNIAHLSAGRLKTVEFPKPPLDEQRVLVARADEQLTAIARLDLDVGAAQQRSLGLRRALLNAAFSAHLADSEASEAEGVLHG